MTEENVMWALNWGPDASHVMRNCKTFYELDNLYRYKEEHVEERHYWRIVKLDFVDPQRQFPIPYLHDANYPSADQNLM